MTIGEGEPNRYIVIHPGTRHFESRNPKALFVALSRAKRTGMNNGDPDFARHPSVLVNEDRLCHQVYKNITRLEIITSPTSEYYVRFIPKYGNHFL
jgi:hypothetical protein